MMRSIARGSWFALSALLAAAASLSGQSAAPGRDPGLAWTACASALPVVARCGTLRVPENHAAPQGRSITIAFHVLRATGPTRAPDPVLVLLGGPGDAASPRLGALVAAHAAVNRERDVVLVDQRGTGRSSPLPCASGSDDDLQSYMDFLDATAVRDCIAAVRASADAARYRTRDFVADLEALRRALGVRQWHLHGTSYGSRIAQQYMARHAESVRSAILVGAVPFELAMPAAFGEDADRAFTMLVDACTADAACRDAFPRLRAETDSVARRLTRAPATVTVPHPASGAPAAIRFTRAAFGEAVRATLYTPAGAAVLPIAIHEAYAGDYRAIATAHLRRQRTIAREGWNGLYLAATCPEDVARLDRQAVLAANRETLLGEYRARQHVAACALWPAGAEVGDWPPNPRITVPVLLIVGDADPVTPPRWSSTSARTMLRHRLVVVPGGAHGFAGMPDLDCLTRLQAAFYASANPAGLDAGCVARMRRPPFVTVR